MDRESVDVIQAALDWERTLPCPEENRKVSAQLVKAVHALVIRRCAQRCAARTDCQECNGTGRIPVGKLNWAECDCKRKEADGG